MPFDVSVQLLKDCSRSFEFTALERVWQVPPSSSPSCPSTRACSFYMQDCSRSFEVTALYSVSGRFLLHLCPSTCACSFIYIGLLCPAALHTARCTLFTTLHTAGTRSILLLWVFPWHPSGLRRSWAQFCNHGRPYGARASHGDAAATSRKAALGGKQPWAGPGNWPALRAPALQASLAFAEREQKQHYALSVLARRYALPILVRRGRAGNELQGVAHKPGGPRRTPGYNLRGVLTWMSSWGLEVHIRLFRSWTPCNPFRIWDDANFAAAAGRRPPFHSSPGGSSVMDPNPFRIWDDADFAATAAWRPGRFSF